ARAADESLVAASNSDKLDPLLAGMKATLSTRALSDEELEKLSNFLQSHPNDVEGHLVLANAYNKMGMTEMYGEELEKTWRLSPQKVSYLIAAMKIRAGSDDHAGFDRLVDE